jgi:hypothetical protein
MTDAQFVAMACRTMIANSSDDEERPNAPPHQIAIVTCPECKRGWHDVHGQSIELSPAALERARCDAVELGCVDDDLSAPPDATRTIPAPMRRAVLARDHHRCRIPGCTMSKFVDVHHVDHWAETKAHVMNKLLTVCDLHHSMHHDGTIHISGTSDALVVTHPDGRPYGMPPPADASTTPTPAELGDETRLALTGMGFRPAEARAAVARAATHVSRTASLEDWIRAALSECSPPRA